MIYAFLIIFSISYSLSSYYFENTNATVAANFSDGKWLLRKIEAQTTVNNRLEETAITDFKSYLNKRFTYLPLTK